MSLATQSKLKKALQNPELIKQRIRRSILEFVYRTKYKYWIYASYRKYRKTLGKQILPKTPVTGPAANRYISIVPHAGAGIGHQLANWNTALILSKQFNLKFAHHPFAANDWETFLDFGNGETQYKTLLKDPKIQKVRLPKVDAQDIEGHTMLNTIINQVYPEDNILFQLENNQGVHDHTRSSEILRKKYLAARASKPVQTYFASDKLTIAVHVRRGDIVGMKNNNSSNWQERWLDDSYFINIMKTLYQVFDNEAIETHIYSQGNAEEFAEYTSYPNVKLHINEDVFQTFHHLVMADILVTSPSSFSYKAGIMSSGVKIAKYPWWHFIPESGNWLRSDASGNFDPAPLVKKYSKYTQALHN